VCGSGSHGIERCIGKILLCDIADMDSQAFGASSLGCLRIEFDTDGFPAELRERPERIAAAAPDIQHALRS
jgi:hypothetical protein